MIFTMTTKDYEQTAMNAENTIGEEASCFFSSSFSPLSSKVALEAKHYAKILDEMKSYELAQVKFKEIFDTAWSAVFSKPERKNDFADSSAGFCSNVYEEGFKQFLKLDLTDSSSIAFKLEHWVSWLEKMLDEDLEMMRKQTDTEKST